nr:MAG TPA: tail protein [Bacteriophage sp.]
MVLESNTLDVLFVKDGQQGEDGKILYTWIKYAKDASGTGMTDDPNGAIYIGISYNNESSIESNDPTQYAWTKIQGADGKKGEDAYTIFLENENISFATDKNRNPLSEQAYTSGITIMKGAKPVTDFTIGDIAKTQGIAVAKTDTAIAISVVNGNSLPNDSGEIEIPITVDGTVFKKILTWTCAKKGDQGEKGEQGIQGPQGEQGIAGKDGTSVTITNKSITYQLSTSGTTIPTGTWQTSPQTIPEGQYQWTKTSVTYSDGNKTESYSISYHGKNGSNGTSVKTTSTSVKYQVGDSGTTKPTGTWQANVPTVVQGKYLWTQTIVNYSDGNSTESYSVAYRGIDGNNGVNGMNAATIYLYQRATSTPNKPSNTLTYTFSTTKITGTLNNGWSTAIPTGTDAVYVTVASVSSKNDTATIATSAWSAPVVLAQNGKTGSDGKAGLNVATIYLYQRNTSKPSKPSASVTYTFSTGVASGLNNGWSQKIPDGTNPLYVTLATASSNTATDTILSSEWSDVVVMAQNGEDGISPKVSLSKSGNTTTISIIDATGTHTQTVKDGTNGTPGAAGKDGKTSYFHVKYSNDGGKTFTSNSGEDTGIYMGSYTDYTETDSTDVKKYNWVKVKGDKGDTGQKGQNAKNLSITPSSQYFKSTDGGKTFAPNTITIKPTIQGEISFGKWQYSIDGGVSFADIVSGQKGLTINNNVLTVSKDSSLYSDGVTMVTFRAVANDSSFYDTCSIAKIYDVSDIGDGRNLLTGVSSYTKDTPFEKTDSRADGWTMYQNIITSIELEAGKKYVLQAKTDGNWAANHDTNGQDPSKKLVTLWLCSDKTNNCFDMRQGYAVFTPTVTAKYKLRVNQYSNGTDAYTIHLWDIKLEKGSSPTGWTPAPEDLQTAILSTKSEISDVSLKVDKNKQAIEQRVEKNTYQQDLTLVKGDISKANEGLNKWRYEIYPKSLFTDKPEDQSKYDIGVFIRNKNLTPSHTLVFDDNKWTLLDYENNYIGYGLTFVKMSAKKTFSTKWAHSSSCSIYVNGKLIISDKGTVRLDSNNTGRDFSCTFIEGWNCIEFVMQETTGNEWFFFKDAISAISECQLMNCYYGTPVARQSHITNQLVQNTTDIDGVSGSVQQVMSTVGGSGKVDEFVNNYSTWKKKVDGIENRVGETYTTKSDFNGLEIGGRNLARDTSNEYSTPYTNFNGSTNTCFYDKRVYLNGLKAGDTITVHMYVKYDDIVPTSGQTARMWTQGSGNVTVWNSGTFPASSRQSLSGSGVCEILYSATVYKDSEKNQYWECCIRTDYIQSGSMQIKSFKVEKGNKPTDWTPAPEDDEINGQNLVSNLPSNWEQGTVTEGSAIGTTYANTKSSSAGSIRPKELIPVSGDITISIAYSNQSKKPIRHWIAAYDVNKNYLGNNYVSNAWNSFPRTLDMKDAKYIAIMVGYTDSSAITPSDISQICLKIERGTSATPFTLAPEDVNGKIVNVETIANQTANKFEWIVKGGDSSSNFTLTDRVADLVAERINFNGLVKFSGLAKSTQDKINSPTSGNLITVSPTNPTSNYGNITFSIVSDDVGGRCIQTTAQFVPFTNYASNIFKPGEQIYYNINVPNWSSTTFDANLGIWFFTAEKKCVANSCTRVTLQRTAWNRLSGYITVPTSGWSGIIYYVIGIENPNKYQLGLVSNSYIEKTTSYATTYASSAVNWVTNNGSSTTSLNSMVKKWTDGAVSDTTQINGGWIKANTITASKIAVGDFTNYADINESNTYGFSVEKTTDGVWFSKDGSKLTRDNYISKMYSCEPGQTFYVEYDISNTIKDSTEYKAAGIMLFGCDGTQTVKWYQRRGAVVGTAAGTVTHMSQQLTMPSGTRFFYVVLQIEGFQPFTGTLKIRNLSVRKAVTGAVIVDGSITADKIATDAIKSRNYISSGGTQGSFLNLSDGSFQSPNLSWDSNGNLIAKNANLSGQITATKGSIGGWSVDNYSIYTTYDSDQNIFGSGISGTKGKYVLWAGETNNAIGANRSSDTPTDASLVIYNNGGLEVRKTMVGNDKKNHLYTTILQSGQINLKMDDNYIGTITATDTISSNSTVTMSHVSMAAKKGYGWSILHTDDSGNLISDIQRDPGDTKIKIRSPITVSSTDITKYNAIETTGDVVVNGKIHANYGPNRIQFNPDNNGSIELYGGMPFIDFHFACSNADYTSRIISQHDWDCLTFTGSILLGGDIYNSSNGHYTWDGKTDAYLGCGNYSGGNNIYYYANYHAFYVNNDSGSGMMYINTNGVTSRVGFTKTSDERIKKNFESFDDNIIDAYMNIEPVKYQLKQSSNDNYHFGFKAQHVDKVFSDYGDTYNESFDICTSRPIDPDKAKELYGVDDMTEEYGLRYDELIAPTTYMVQHIYKELESTKGELAKVKQEKTDLETRLQAIEAKLGL